MAHKNVVTRFAPSPTGFLHIGGVRTALFAWLFARKHTGTFILRIEDTDKQREVAGSVAHIQTSLRWLGLEWDYGPDQPGPFGSCVQSERLDTYRTYAQKLYDTGLAYPLALSDEELAARRDECKAKEKPFLFRNHRPEISDQWDGVTPLLFKIPDVTRVHWHDVVRGELSAGADSLDDFIIIKADGYPTYNFAHIIDDYEMGVTHVMRGEEFLSSIPKYLSLYDALAIPRPELVTLPPILGPDGKKKLSKRDGAQDLLAYRDAGYLPEALRNFLALIGWNPGTEQELFPDDTLVTAFDLAKIQKSGGAFNEEKLRWLNHTYLTADLIPGVPVGDFHVNYIKDALPAQTRQLPQYSDARLAALAPTILERVHNKPEIQELANAGEYDWAFATPAYDATLLQWKHDTTVQDVLPRLTRTRDLLATADFTSPETIKTTVWPYAEAVGKGEVLWPLRVALTGRERSPDPFTCAFVLGPTETINRLHHACAKIPAHGTT